MKNTGSIPAGRIRGRREAGARRNDMATIEVKVPDIGDFADVPVITVFVKAGDVVQAEDALIEIESDKATMEVPAPSGGKVAEVKMKEGDRISEGMVILVLEEEGEADAPAEAKPEKAQAAPAEQAPPAKQAAPAVPAAPAPVDDGGSRTGHAGPSVLAMARLLGVDLKGIAGAGRKGRIVREDVTAALKAAAAAAGAPGAGGVGIPPVPVVDFPKSGPVENVEMPRIKK